MKILITPSPEKISEVLDYDPGTGIFVWRARQEYSNAWNAKCAGKVAGAVLSNQKKGWHAIRMAIDGQMFYAHRLAWKLMTGEEGPEEIDHRDGDGTNNAWLNLRDGTGINPKNKSMLKNNTSGYTGVSWHKQRQKWAVRIKVGGRYNSYGLYADKEEAAAMATSVRASFGYDNRHGANYSPMRLEQMA